MVRAGTDGLHIPFPALIKSLTVMSCKGVDLPLQIVGLVGIEELLVVLSLSELSQILALSLRVKGKAFSLSKSISNAPSLKVVQTSSKSRMCVYGFSYSIP